MVSNRRQNGGWVVGSAPYEAWKIATVKKRKRRARWLRWYKEKKGCSICGYNKSGYALDFNHLDPSQKKFNASGRMLNYSLKRIFNEIRKCNIMCANCHRIESFGKYGV